MAGKGISIKLIERLRKHSFLQELQYRLLRYRKYSQSQQWIQKNPLRRV